MQTLLRAWPWLTECQISNCAGLAGDLSGNPPFSTLGKAVHWQVFPWRTSILKATEVGTRGSCCDPWTAQEPGAGEGVHMQEQQRACSEAHGIQKENPLLLRCHLPTRLNTAPLKHKDLRIQPCMPRAQKRGEFGAKISITGTVRPCGYSASVDTRLHVWIPTRWKEQQKQGWLSQHQARWHHSFFRTHSQWVIPFLWAHQENATMLPMRKLHNFFHSSHQSLKVLPFI